MCKKWRTYLDYCSVLLCLESILYLYTLYITDLQIQNLITSGFQWDLFK